MTKLCSTVRCSRLLHFFQSSRVLRCTKSLRGVNASVFFLICSLKANPSSVPLGKQQSCARERRDVDDCVWFGLEDAQDRTMWARFSLVWRQSTKKTSWISRKEVVMLGPVSKVAETGPRIRTVTMWSMRCFFGESMCQLLLC